MAEVKKRTTRRKSTGAGTSTKAKKAKVVSAEEKKRDRIITIITLSALSLLFFFIVFIPGDKIWLSVHNFFRGVFGALSYILPFLTVYIIVSMAYNKPFCKISTKIILSVVLVFLLCSAVFIFSSNFYTGSYADFNLDNYSKILVNTFTFSQANGGPGIIGAIFGFPLVSVAGNPGAGIIVIIAAVAVFLVLSLDVIAYLRTKYLEKEEEKRAMIEEIDKSIKDAESKKAADRVEKYREERQKRKSRLTANIDIDLGPDMPKHPVVSTNDKTDAVQKATESVKKQGDSDKTKDIDNIKEVAKAFMEKNKPDTKVITQLENALKEPPVTENSECGEYIFPPVSLLDDSQGVSSELIQEELEVNGLMLVDTLKSFGVQTKIVDISRGPAVTRFELQPAAGVKISKITNLADDIALNLAASGVRIEAPIPGKAAVGVEIPNRNVMIVRMKELISSTVFNKAKSKLTAALGRDIAGNITVTDLAKMPHLLIAGSTGAGKSVCINSLIISLLYKASPDDVKFLMIDPKVVELGIYNGIPHLLVPVVTDARKAAGALNWAVSEMLKRYRMFANTGVRDLQSYNAFVNKVKNGMAVYKPDDEAEEETPLEIMPQIVIIIDELSDLMMAAPKEVEDSICRLAQMARAAGMHLIIATQRPSVDVITGIIKANIPSRIAFAVSSQIDSRTILDMGGAEKLLGRGDMLFSPIGVSKPKRIQGSFVTDEEIEKVVDFIKRAKEANYDERIMEEIEKNAVLEKKSGNSNDSKEEKEDALFEDAVECILEAGQASTSMLQRRLRVGYARAGRLIDVMEQKGIIGPPEGSKPRQILITKQQWIERKVAKTE